jgi:hypothetical protein
VQEKLRAKTFKHGFFEHFRLRDLDEVGFSTPLEEIPDDPRLLDSKTSAIVSLWKLCTEESDNPKLEYVKHVTISDPVFDLKQNEGGEGTEFMLKLPEFLYLVKHTTRIVFV